MGKNWAISIGINKYDNLQDLNFAKRDAEAMAAWFREEAKFDQVFLFTEDSPAINT
ncbi:caspase family protein, partial [Dolichospermum circinale CS-545/17]|nr:caspase family protein [Dolichospermum circinale CS-545/17]